ncbi:hypothetical protein [Ancylomarina sp.]|uniref:hypothetical protein n=1 Tax=Ancylomarina sp. TaxID=1970196 RepID=UPI003568CBE0
MNLRKIIILSSAIMVMSLSTSLAQNSNQNANQLVKFLEGKWHNYSILVSDSSSISKEDYKEKMSIKNDSTITITAYNYKDGKDLTRDMILVVKNNIVTTRQGDFKASGICEGNVYSMKGYFEDKEYRFRLYTMNDKYIFHREVWVNGKVEMMNMSYLLRE